MLAGEQEGFRRKRNTVRSLYRLHLDLEHARSTKTPTALLNIDLEKAFDSVWIDGLLYKLRHYHVNGVVGENISCRKFHFDKHSSEVYIQQLG